jgi:hypothetical protein
MKRAVPQSQQDFLRDAMAALGLTREQFAERIGAKKRALDNWLLPSDSKEFRAMPDMAWKFVREILSKQEQKA